MGNGVLCGETADSNDQTSPSSNESNDEFIPFRSATGVGDTRYNPILSHPPPLFTRNGPHRRMNSIGPSVGRHSHLQPDGRFPVPACSFRHRVGRAKTGDRLGSLSHRLESLSHRPGSLSHIRLQRPARQGRRPLTVTLFPDRPAYRRLVGRLGRRSPLARRVRDAIPATSANRRPSH